METNAKWTFQAITYKVIHRMPYRWCIVDAATDEVIEGGFFTRAAAEEYLAAEYE